MADSRKLFPNALTGLPAPERRVLDSIGMNIVPGKPENGYGKPSIASVDRDSPNTLVIHDPQRFRQGGQQVLAHEGVHLWQNNLPPALAAKIPPDNPQNPYGFNLQQLRDTRQHGGNLLSLPREQQASAIQYFVANGGENAPKPIRDAIEPYAEDMNRIPLSTIMPTDPNQKGINTTPRPPMALPRTYATSLFTKGDPPPAKDDDPYAAFGGNIVHTGTGGTDPYAEFGGSIVHGPAAPGTGLNRYGQIDYGTGLAPAQQSQEGATQPQQHPWLQRMARAGGNLGNLGTGALKGLGGNSVLGIDKAVSQIPYIGKALTTPLIGGKTSGQAISDLQNRTQANGTMQKRGKGLEGAVEFLIPGLGEDAATADIARVTPKLMRVARIGYNALTSGLLNKGQGGSFGLGAAGGAAGSTLGEGLRALAPPFAESAMGIRKLDRTYGKTPGRAILDETKGFSPASVAESAQGRLNELNPMLEQAADRASVRPATPIRGLLQAPEWEVPLNRGINRGSTRGGLFPAGIRQDFAEGPDLYPEAGRAPGAMEERGTPINGNERYTAGIPNPQYLPGGPHPELSGRFAPPSGVLKTRRPLGGRQPVDEFGRITPPEPPSFAPLPETAPNRIASLIPARKVVGTAIGRATTQNAAKEAGQLQPLSDFLQRRFDTGEEIPATITPRQLLDFRRGFGSEFVHNWNPETMPGVTGTARNTYHALSNEFHNAVPEAVPLDRRISNLIPVAKRAESASREASLGQRVAGRLKAHTGAATLGGIGAIGGYERGGPKKALEYGPLGLAAPEILASPSVQMAGARTLNSPVVKKLLVPAAKGGALQLAARRRK